MARLLDGSGPLLTLAELEQRIDDVSSLIDNPRLQAAMRMSVDELITLKMYLDEFREIAKSHENQMCEVLGARVVKRPEQFNTLADKADLDCFVFNETRKVAGPRDPKKNGQSAHVLRFREPGNRTSRLTSLGISTAYRRFDECYQEIGRLLRFRRSQSATFLVTYGLDFLDQYRTAVQRFVRSGANRKFQLLITSPDFEDLEYVSQRWNFPSMKKLQQSISRSLCIAIEAALDNKDSDTNVLIRGHHFVLSYCSYRIDQVIYYCPYDLKGLGTDSSTLTLQDNGREDSLYHLRYRDVVEAQRDLPDKWCTLFEAKGNLVLSAEVLSDQYGCIPRELADRIRSQMG